IVIKIIGGYDMTDEHLTRLKELQDYLKKEDIEVGMITSPANVFYYTGFDCDPHERFMSLVIDNLANKFHLFVPALDLDLAKGQDVITNITPISDEENPFEILKDKLGAKEVTRFGLEMKEVNVFNFNHLNNIYPDAKFTDIQPFVNSQRMKKSRTEINFAQEAVRIIENVLAEGIKKVSIGMTESELVAELEYLMRKLGADGPSFSSIVLSGEKSALPHGSPGERRLQAGDFLLIDFGVLKDGYCSDITRTFIIGEASDKQEKIYDIVLQSNVAGIEAVQAGVPLQTFDHAARQVIEESGYGKYFQNRVGHGIGIEIHEEPSVHVANEQLAEEGLLFTIEPGIYIPGFGGVRIEDEVYINEEGKAEVLTSFPKQMQII